MEVVVTVIVALTSHRRFHCSYCSSTKSENIAMSAEGRLGFSRICPCGSG